MIKNLIFLSVVVLLSYSVQAEVLWFDDLESYVPDTTSWTGEPDVPWIQVTGTDLGSSVVEFEGQWPSGNGTQMLMANTSVSTRAWTKRPFGQAIAPDADVQLTARVCANTDGRDTSLIGWPVSNHMFLCGVGLGIRMGYVAWGPLEYGVATPRNTHITSYHNVVLRPISPTGGDPWYDIKIVVHQNAGPDNDTADLYYRELGETEWISIVKGYDTGNDLDDHVWVYQYNSAASSARYYPGWLDHMRLSSPPVGEDCSDVIEHLATDFNKDCVVNIIDFASITQHWLECNDPEPLNCN